MIIRKDQPLGRAVVDAIHQGDVDTVKRLHDENPRTGERQDRRTPNCCLTLKCTSGLILVCDG